MSIPTSIESFRSRSTKLVTSGTGHELKTRNTLVPLNNDYVHTLWNGSIG